MIETKKFVNQSCFPNFIFIQENPFDQSPLYKLHKDYPLLMPSTQNPRSCKIINHGFFNMAIFWPKL